MLTGELSSRRKVSPEHGVSACAVQGLANALAESYLGCVHASGITPPTASSHSKIHCVKLLLQTQRLQFDVGPNRPSMLLWHFRSPTDYMSRFKNSPLAEGQIRILNQCTEQGEGDGRTHQLIRWSLKILHFQITILDSRIRSVRRDGLNSVLSFTLPRLQCQLIRLNTDLENGVLRQVSGVVLG